MNKQETEKLTEENARLRDALTELVQLANHPLTVDALDITKSTEINRAKQLLKGDEDENKNNAAP